jgi:hypothetical protein
MKKLTLALALVATLCSTSAFAQTVDDATTKELWCGTALTIYYSNPPAEASADDLAKAKVFLGGTAGMIDEATQKYLNAGFTEEQVSKVKADLKTELTKLVTGKDETGAPVTAAPTAPPPYSFDDCITLLQSRLPADASTPSSSSSAAQ